jgi:hypothetical protein
MRIQEADVRRELAVERAQLIGEVEELRQSTDLRTGLRDKLPLLVVGAFAVGFLLAGGLGATARLFFRRSREGHATARFGPYTLVSHR